ncbi:MAG: hypothetical protein HZA08_03570 [Nitrospirae bacterium]|nr:hypothetical protein [Nitrospirota bacterium]
MKDVQAYFKGFRVNEPQTYENLTIFPLFREEAPGTYYLMLDEALKKGIVTVTEVNDTGRFAELWLRNDADIPILLLDGEELAGAKQDRILNASILVPAETAMTDPKLC